MDKQSFKDLNRFKRKLTKARKNLNLLSHLYLQGLHKGDITKDILIQALLQVTQLERFVQEAHDIAFGSIKK